jgi:hypothetical protein
MPTEVVYVNGGEIYKAPRPAEFERKYARDPDGEIEFPFRKADGKGYFFTSEFKAYFSGDKGIPLTGLDLCPDVTLWICFAATEKTERSNFDLYFSMDSADQIKKVAAYYGLPVPATDAMMAEVEAAPECYSFWNAGGRPIVPAGVKFIDGKPAIFKLYTYPKPFGSWDVWMYGASYHNGGKCWEAGAVYSKPTGGVEIPGAQMRARDFDVKAEVIYSDRADGAAMSYEFIRTLEPVMQWRGNEIDESGNTVRTKHYESSDFVRRMVANMAGGPTYAEFALCPAVKFWLGRAWYDDDGEQELLFAVVDGSNQLDRVAAYYGLPAPYSAEQKAVLDTRPELYRARHYDLYGQGEGRYAPVIVASVTFLHGKPIRLLFYTFMRQWEFEEQIELPAPSN